VGAHENSEARSHERGMFALRVCVVVCLLLCGLRACHRSKRRFLLIVCDSHEFGVRVSNNSDASNSCAYHTDTHRCAMQGRVCQDSSKSCFLLYRFPVRITQIRTAVRALERMDLPELYARRPSVAHHDHTVDAKSVLQRFSECTRTFTQLGYLCKWPSCLGSRSLVGGCGE
jgi:hypothetical protein